MDGLISPCCGACGHAAEVAAAGGPAPNPNPHLRVSLDAGGVPRGVMLEVRTPHGTELVPVRKGYVVLGRTAPADVVVGLFTLSRRQCGFDFSSGEVVVEDLDSACGTYVNGAQTSRAALRAGDEVSAGDLVVRVLVIGG
jgi:pSer/pThr/pTyr-binding forkhead associated (FHA) protein